ncbi:UNVERIFIED_CONTAM: UDP-glycosyltransferase 73C3 [Sesamum radiatum]|uniref:UDP-glycosyltransferase 73C3 n=1 Tax=Sesamum radiatum TaxID=300843 RepID=A0AAW2KAE7_SESRA
MFVLEQKPHIVMLPFMAQAHMLPMVDLARVLAKRGSTISILATPHNAGRFKSVIDRAIATGLDIHVLHLKFPCSEVGLPDGCENFDMLASGDDVFKFFRAIDMLKEQVQEMLRQLEPAPSCLIADACFPSWTTNVALKLHFPRILFYATTCQSEAFGAIVVNTFEELESEYIKEYKKAIGKGVWCVGPVSLCNKDYADKVESGNKLVSTAENEHCLKWLDSKEPGSVIYVCLGSQSSPATLQLIELALALEASNRPFIWVLRNPSEESEKWLLEEKIEERIKDRGLLIRSWAPQVLILSHPSIGAFLTHCGGNSMLEGMAAGMPMLTWPVFSDTFRNEKLIVKLIKIGLRIGVEKPVFLGEDDDEHKVQVKKDEIKKAIEKLMNGGEEANEMRKRAKELGEMAKRAVEEGGSSYLNVTLFIQDVIGEQARLAGLE